MHFFRVVVLLVVALMIQSCAVTGSKLPEQDSVKSNKAEVSADVYLVPMADFPESVSIIFAKLLSRELKVNVQSAPKLGKLNVSLFPGTNQFVSDEILEKSQPILKSLRESPKAKYCLLLTKADIRSASGRDEFSFSWHKKILIHQLPQWQE